MEEVGQEWEGMRGGMQVWLCQRSIPVLLGTIGSQPGQVSPDTPNPFLTSDLVLERFLETGL